MGGHYIHEDSIEVDDSLNLLEQALTVSSSLEFNELVQKAAKQAEAGYGSMKTWGPRLASLRWLCSIWWLAARVEVVNRNSAGASFGTIDPRFSEQVNWRAKNDMIHWISDLVHEAPVLKIFDHDLMGCGVYMNSRSEPLPRGGNDAWFRRQMQFDLASLCSQLRQLPPVKLNLQEPKLQILRPYGEPTWMLPPPEALRPILLAHGWIAEPLTPPIDQVPAKALIQGKVLHIDAPAPYEFDLTDPEIIARVQRGEKLGKGPQDDGLPGAIHGSLSLLYAGVVAIEGYDNVKIYSDILEIDDFLEKFLEYCPRLVTLDLSGAEGAMDEEFLMFISHCGPSLRVLDLENCNLDGSVVDTLVDTCEALKGLQHLDLAYNNIDAAMATLFLASLAERRIDLQTVRLDGNPVGDMYEFRQDVAGLLAARGDQVVAGGELVLHLDVDAVRWLPEPKADTLAARRRNDTLMMAATSFDELIDGAHQRNADIDQLYMEGRDPRTRTIAGKEMLQKERDLNNKILSDSMLRLYESKIVNEQGAGRAEVDARG